MALYFVVRYKGKKVSRKDIFSEEDDSDDVSDEGRDSDKDLSASMDENSEDDNDEIMSKENSSMEDEQSSDSDVDDNNDDDDDEDVEENPLRQDRKNPSNITNMTKTDTRADVEKGNCVRGQLKLWQTLLEVRIKLQKCLITSNKMPQYDTYKQMKTNEKFKKETKLSKNALSGLLDNLLEMQSNLLTNYPETKNLHKGTKRKAENPKIEDPMDEEICSDTDDETNKEIDESDEESSKSDEDEPAKKKKKRSLAEYEKIISENYNAYRNYSNSVIQKWNDKTRVATGSVNKGSSRAVIQQIEFALSDKYKLLKKTQLKRSEYQVVGKETIEDEDGRRNQEYDGEIYDDDDFYHQLLRQLIEQKTSDITDPIQLSKQWIQLQNMRNKMKRKIDTRATKGRRLRYNVHTKLVNFMAPIEVNDTWSTQAKNELYNSLFGKITVAKVATETNNEDTEKTIPIPVAIL